MLCVWPYIIGINRGPIRCNNKNLLIFKLAQNVSGNSLPILRSARRWYNAPRLLSVGGFDCRSMDCVFGVRDVAGLKSSKELPETCWASLKINKLLLLHLVCPLFYLFIALNIKHLEGGLLRLQEFVLNHSQNDKKTRHKSSWFMVEIPTRIARLSSCIMLGVSCKRILSRMPVGRNTVQWGPATLQAMTYPIHENGFRRSLTRCILHQSAVTGQCLKWHDVIPILVRRLCHLAPLLWQMCVL